MIIPISALIGMLLGGLSAKRRGGNRKDIAQYAVSYGIAFALLGLFITLVIVRNFV